MIVPFRRFLLLACLLGPTTALLAQIPNQAPRTINPNALPPTGFNRPTAPGQRPAGGLGNPAGGEQRQAIKPDDAIKPSGGVELAFPNTPISQILLVYEDLTGLKIIRDAAIEQVTVSIETTGELTKERAIKFIEKSLLLNGYSFAPAGDGMVKILGEGKRPQAEGAPLFESAADLPDTDQVVSFVALLKYLNPDDAVKAIDQVIPRHSYGVLTPVPNAKALVIVENSSTIRSILELLERLDVKPGATVTKRIQLVRSDAEDVKKALDEILGLDEKEGGSAPGGRANIPPAGQQPGGVPQQQLAGLPGDSSSGTAAEVKPKILAIPRTNRLLVIAMPETAEYIETLTTELDSASELRTFVSRTLNYLSVEAAMGIIGDAIARTEGEGSGSGGGSSVNSLGQPNNSSSNRNGGTGTGTSSSGLFGNSTDGGFGGNSGFGNSGGGFGNSGGFGSSGGGLGGGGFGGGGGFSGAGGGGNLQPLRVNNGPRSIVIGKTLLISDPTANSLFASGPPEHLRALNEILDELDRRPQQILISAVIAEAQVLANKDLGIRTVIRAPGRNGSFAGGFGRAGGPSFDPRTDIPLVGSTGGTGAATVAGLASGSGLSFYGAISNSMDVIINAIEADSTAKIISRPTVFTLNNTPAAISTGTSFPIATSSQNLGTGAGGLISNVQYQDVALSLNIVPLINTPDELTLQISQENSDQVGERIVGETNYPLLSKQLLTTVVMCKNNSTVLLGGLIRDSKSDGESRVPFLSKVPVLKLLTKSTEKDRDRRELLIFIQPRIVEGLHDLPPTYKDGLGTSTFGQEAMDFMHDERRIAAEHDKTAMTPVRRNRVHQLVRKLFGRDREHDVDPDYISSPAEIQAPK